MTDSALITEADVIKNEVTLGANTASRVGIMLEDIINNKINNDKISTNTSLGTSDALLPSQNAVRVAIANAVGSIFTAKIVLSSAQLLTGFSVPINVIAAAGANTIIQVFKFVVVMSNGIPYSTNTTVMLKINGNTVLSITSLLEQVDFAEIILGSSFATSPASNIVNQPLTFSVSNGDPTAGNESLTFYITYTVISL